MGFGVQRYIVRSCMTRVHWRSGTTHEACALCDTSRLNLGLDGNAVPISASFSTRQSNGTDVSSRLRKAALCTQEYSISVASCTRVPKCFCVVQRDKVSTVSARWPIRRARISATILRTRASQNRTAMPRTAAPAATPQRTVKSRRKTGNC